MWVHFFVGNHDAVGQLTLHDMIQWFEAGFRELNHHVTAGNTLAPGAINLIWENSARGHALALKESGVTYGIVGTEIPDGTGFNWRSDPPWPERWRAFEELAHGASFIWSMIENSVVDYSRFAPTGFMELGYSDLLIPYQARWDPEFDFGFYGLLTPHRQAVLEELGRYCKIITPKTMLLPSELSAFISQCRIGINFRQSPQWPIPSPTRLGRLLHARRGAVSEYVPIPTRQGLCAAIAGPTENFPEYCLDRLGRDWKQDAEDSLERYRTTMPMKDILERLLDATIAGNPRVAKRAAKTPDQSRTECRPLIRAPQPTFVEMYESFNIVQLGSALVAVAQECGGLDVDAILSGRMPQPPEDLFVVLAAPLEQLKARINELQAAKQENLKSPRIVDSYLGFNIIRWKEEWVAVAQSLGTLDVVAVLQGKIPAPAGDLYLIASSPQNQLRQRIEALCNNTQLRNLPPQLVEAFQGFNIVYCSGEYVAVAQTLGAVDVHGVVDGRVQPPPAKDFIRLPPSPDQLKQTILRTLPPHAVR